MLLPRIVPRTKSPFLFLAALMPTANSGNEVPRANTVAPRIPVAMLSSVLMFKRDPTKYFAERIIPVKEIMIINTGLA